MADEPEPISGLPGYHAAPPLLEPIPSGPIGKMLAGIGVLLGAIGLVLSVIGFIRTHELVDLIF